MPFRDNEMQNMVSNKKMGCSTLQVLVPALRRAGGLDCNKMNYIKISLRSRAFLCPQTEDTFCSFQVTVWTVVLSISSGILA